MARQPEVMGRLQTAMILAFAFIESLVIFSFVFLFLLKAGMPSDPEKVLAVIQATGGK